MIIVRFMITTDKLTGPGQALMFTSVSSERIRQRLLFQDSSSFAEACGQYSGGQFVCG